MARNVLAALLLNANRVVSAGRLVDVLWGDDPPASAVPSLHNHVMRLRAALGELGASRVKTVAPGYLIEVGDGELDLDEFGRLSRRGRDALAAGDWDTALRGLSAALALERGEPLADVTSRLLREQEMPRLVQMRLDVVEARIDARLRLGRSAEAIAELAALTVSYPLRERFHEQLMLACYQKGQQAEALNAYRRAREVLAGELGTEPGPGLRRLHQQVLAQDPGLVIAARREAAVRPAQLPADLGDFTGRGDEVTLLTGLGAGAWQQPGVVPVCVVTGPGGIGKTSLAIHAAHQIRDRFADGELYARLGGSAGRLAEPRQVLGRFLRDLGGDPAQIPYGEAERAARFRSVLAGRRVLIVLDDARDSGQVVPLLPGVTGCAVIVTSRSPLADLPNVCQLSLKPLTSGQALELLSRIVGSPRLRAEAGPAANVAELCAGLPLAVRIAGARLAARPHWQVKELADRLADTAARLDELAVGDLSVRASFAASYVRLRADPGGLAPARAFRLLGLWAGPDISTPAVAALLGVDPHAAEHALETLLDSHLLQAGRSAGRYHCNGLLSVYAAERAREEDSPADTDAAMQRLLAWYLHSAVAASQAMAPGARPIPLGPLPEGLPPCEPYVPAQAVAWLTAELPNLRAAAQTAAAREDHQTSWKFTAVLSSFQGHQSPWAIQIDRLAADGLGARALIADRGDGAVAMKHLVSAIDLSWSVGAARNVACQQASPEDSEHHPGPRAGCASCAR
jgi:DNA-binding SARP family transcriptional activator